MTRRYRRPHAILIPVHTTGHWMPFKGFLYQMVNQGISFTLLGSKNVIKEAQIDKDNGQFDKLDHVELVEVFDEEKFQVISHTCITKTMRDQFYSEHSVMESLIRQIATGLGPTFIISDMFLSWTQELGDALGIPRYVYFPSPCGYALGCLHGATLLNRGLYSGNPDLTGTTLESSVNLPGLEKYLVKDLPASLNAGSGRPTYESHSRSMPKAAGFLLNGFEEMHVEESRALQRLLQDLATDREAARVYFVGPQLQIPTPTGVRRKQRMETKLAPLETNEKSTCLQFLDSQQAASVLYICFGSVGVISESSIAELAKGLEESGVSFLWIARRPEDAVSSRNTSQVLPEGFELRTKGRGLVTGEWAPQKKILSHRSIGGFLSHCGWNSILEAVCRGGIPIICWPLMGDQCMNARLLISLQIGLEMKKSTKGDMVSDEVAKAIHRLMASDEGAQMKRKMQDLKVAASASTVEGGSSYRYFNDFLQEVFRFYPIRSMRDMY